MTRKVAFIPARSGSKRIPNKNIKILGGCPLIAYTIEPALASGEFDDVICLTDSAEYADIAIKYGASVPFLRDTTNAGSKSPDISWLKEAFDKLTEKGDTFDVYSILRPTSPFRTPNTIRRAMKQFLDSKGIDSLRAVEKCSQHPGKMWVKNGGIMYPLLPFMHNGTPWHSNQIAALPDIYVQNASLEICWTHRFLETGQIAGSKVAPFETEGHEGFDINTPRDWDEANQILATQSY